MVVKRVSLSSYNDANKIVLTVMVKLVLMAYSAADQLVIIMHLVIKER